MALSSDLHRPLKIARSFFPCFSVILLFTPRLACAYQAAATKSAPVIEGKVSDLSGALIAGVAIRLEPQSSGPGLSSPSAPSGTTSDEDGKFRLVAPGPGRYVLRASKDHFQTLVVSGVSLANGDSRRMGLVLHPMQNPIFDGDTVPQPTDASPIQGVAFSDRPNFAVAGITDRSNMGLHGSDANTRTSEALAKETAALKSNSAQKSAASSPGDAHRLAGDAKEKSGDPLGAVKEYEAAVKADPSEQNYFAWGAELLLHRASQAAVQVFSSGTKAHPDSSRMLAGLGAAYYSNGQYNEAAAHICQASDLDRSDPAPYLFLGKMEQAAVEPFPCSEKTFSRFAADQPARAEANYFYGLVLWKKNRNTQDSTGLTRAEQLFQRAVELNAQFAEVYLQLGMLYNARGEKRPALTAFQKAVNADPKSSRAHYQLSLAYRRSGDAAKADVEMKTYDDLRHAEDAALEKERRELRQFVTILQEGKSAKP